jgi:hypothetical protein
MAKAKQIAEALRTIAENLEREPEAECGYIFVSSRADDKDIFLNLVRLMPRPFSKEYTDTDLEIEHNFMASPARHDYAVRYYMSIKRAKVCELIEPAKPAVYRCEPILSEAEEATL